MRYLGSIWGLEFYRRGHSLIIFRSRFRDEGQWCVLGSLGE
jgi:hypothetical protein